MKEQGKKFKLIDEVTAGEIFVGDIRKTVKGLKCKVISMIPPRDEFSGSGRVCVEHTGGFQNEYFPSIIGARFVADPAFGPLEEERLDP